MSDVARWNLTVSRRTDVALRRFLAGRDADLSGFVEAAVQAQILEMAAEEAKRQNADRAPQEIAAAVEEALDWARQEPG